MTRLPGGVSAVGWFGDSAVLVSLEDGTRCESVSTTLRSALPNRLVRRGMAAVLVESVQPEPSLLDEVRSALGGNLGDPDASGLERRTVAIPVSYDGTDLVDAASILGCSVEQLSAAHAAQAWTVAMMGFAPGFGYLEPVGDPELDWVALPRRSRPRERVPAGSVAIAAGMSAIYPSAMPGGWHLLGTTTVVLFDPGDEQSPALLAPGDRVRFTRQARS